MPVTKNGVGYSGATPDKQDGFKKYSKLHMRITEKVLSKRKSWCPTPFYHFIDTTAGDGINSDTGDKGSPVIFLDNIKMTSMDYRAWLIDLEEGNTNNLKNIIDDKKCKIINGDSNDILRELVCKIKNPKEFFGMLYHDKNGIADFDLIKFVAETLPHLDILIRCPACSIKRERGRKKSTRESLEESIAGIRKYKESVIIRSPLSSDAWQYIFIFLTNYPNYNEWKSERFFSIDSAEGQKVLYNLNFSKKDIDKMTENERKIQYEIKKRSNGMCEICGTRKATQQHHIKYGWMVSESRIDVCYWCHCKLEGKNP